MANHFSSSTSIPMTDLSKNIHEKNVPGNRIPHQQSLLNTTNSTSIPTSNNSPSTDEIPTYRSWSCFNIFCCSILFGLIALHYSSKTDTLKATRDRQAALNASETAFKINIFGTILGAILLLLLLLFLDPMHLLQRSL